ncbi:MAG TPA: phosphoribosylformylglycinamidine synthase subunit PurL [Planctomycetota bacterium]|nr:phosphoribosylformylglycinamidine synthase subunit PurL [Planctomycetota bacterium]
MLYRIEVGPRENLPDLPGNGMLAQLASIGAAAPDSVRTARLYWLDTDLPSDAVARIAHDLLSDPIVEQVALAVLQSPEQPLTPRASTPVGPLPEGEGNVHSIEVIRKPGVMDPVLASIDKALRDREIVAKHIATGRKYVFVYGKNPAPDANELLRISRKLLANECIEEIHIDRPAPVHTGGGEAVFKLIEVPILNKSDEELLDISKRGCLSLTLAEMKTIQDYYNELGREPKDIELETIAQTWSEHCRHKTMRGNIDLDGPDGERKYDNLLKETIFRATESIGHRRCLSVFKDNAGVVAFDDKWALTFKVETHNHPSAIEPYGGAGTGIGGVIRDTMGTGHGAKPIANTDVFCFGMPDADHESLPPGTLHPRRVMAGVVAGVRDYGNRMGIPTVNGAVHFDPRYVGNPLVFCGSLGLIPRDKIVKHARTGDLVVVLGGRTGRDGIHGATFSSVELSENSEMVSSGAVQIGNAIEEKKVLDVLLKARDEDLYTCVTDCGAGGLSSAVGEMAEDIGAVVDLEKVPLKYAGLTYTEIWISEAQERMVVSVPPVNWPALEQLCKDEDVEGTVIGSFANDKLLRLRYKGQLVGELSMKFLHGGLPRVARNAVWKAPKTSPGIHSPNEALGAIQRALNLDARLLNNSRTRPSAILGPLLRKMLSHPTIASKQWIIRQYDHEVQGRTVIKPLTGKLDDGPSDAAVLTPVLGSVQGVALANGLCPQFAERDPREMAKLAVDECVRNLVAIGGDPANIFILDNFAWGNTSKSEQLGSLTLCCEGAMEAAIAYGAPFISGKDSLNNEYSVRGEAIAIPGTLLISGMSIVEDVRQCITMDLKEPGNLLFVVGLTNEDLGGSHFNLLTGADILDGAIPRVDLKMAKRIYDAMHRAILHGSVRACHDLSEGGLAVAAAEMAFAGGFGAHIELAKVPVPKMLPLHAVLLSESPSRFLVEVRAALRQEFESIMGGLPHACVGEVVANAVLQCTGGEREFWIDEPLDALKSAWQREF